MVGIQATTVNKEVINLPRKYESSMPSSAGHVTLHYITSAVMWLGSFEHIYPKSQIWIVDCQGRQCSTEHKTDWVKWVGEIWNLSTPTTAVATGLPVTSPNLCRYRNPPFHPNIGKCNLQSTTTPEATIPVRTMNLLKSCKLIEQTAPS